MEQIPSAKKPGGILKTSNPCSVADEQKIYQYLLHLVQNESPEQLIERFQTLFIKGGDDYPEPEILSILDTITASKTAAEDFPFFLNRCCHILINHWQMQPQLHHGIIKLINLFESSPAKSSVNSVRIREIRRLHELVKLFVAGEQYLTLRRFTQIVNQNLLWEKNKAPDTQPLMNLIHRYPYLYEHYLVSEESTQQQITIKNFQFQVQNKFEIDLSQYLIYKVRKIQLLQKSATDAANRIRPVDNPTLLTDSELYSTLKQFIGKVENGNTYHELAQNFLKSSSHHLQFSKFKKNLYDYLITSVYEEYGSRKFNDRLCKHLTNTLPQADSQGVDDFLILRTCCQLLNFLVVNSQASPQHLTFLDLISNQGTLPTIGMLLKVVLICRKVKPYLEKRFAILFNHYEYCTTDSTGWLVGTLEQLNIALSIHFGNIDLSFFKSFC